MKKGKITMYDLVKIYTKNLYQSLMLQFPQETSLHTKKGKAVTGPSCFYQDLFKS